MQVIIDKIFGKRLLWKKHGEGQMIYEIPEIFNALEERVHELEHKVLELERKTQ